MTAPPPTLYSQALTQANDSKLVYTKFITLYDQPNGSDGWGWRKVVALPNIALHLAIIPLWHTPAITVLLVYSVVDPIFATHHIQNQFFEIGNNVSEAIAHFAVFFNDRLGLFCLQRNEHYRNDYEGREERQIGPQQNVPLLPPPPPAPPPPLTSQPKKPTYKKRQKNSLQQQQQKEGVAIDMNEVLKMRQKIKKEKKSTMDLKERNKNTLPTPETDRMLKSVQSSMDQRRSFIQDTPENQKTETKSPSNLMPTKLEFPES